jgi:ribosomal protein L3 glutamine methyltransferase
VSRFNLRPGFLWARHDNAYDEAAYLLLHTLHLPLDRLEPFLDAKLTHGEREEVQDIIARRVNERVPAAYLTHEAWLGEHRFYVDERVLIPRSYIAELLRDGLSPWIAEPDKVQTALDLCTGSGCLAILVAHHFPNADVDAADISSDALAVALRNVADHGLQGRANRLRFDAVDLTEKVPTIASNRRNGVGSKNCLKPPRARLLASSDDDLDAVHPRRARNSSTRWPAGRRGRTEPAAAEAAFPRLPFTWLSTQSSDEAVFLLKQDEPSPRIVLQPSPRLSRRMADLPEQLPARVPVARARASAESAASVASFAAWRATTVCASASASSGRAWMMASKAALSSP